MKIAISYSGHIRTWEKCRANQQEFVFRQPDTDLYFYTYAPPENTDVKQFIQVPGTWWDKELDLYQSNRNPYTSPMNSLQSWHTAFVGFCLIPKGYDIYVRSRCDIKLSGRVNYERYPVVNDEDIFIPIGNDHWGGVNDQFAYGSYEVMKIYFSIYLEHLQLFQAGHQFHTEAYVTANLINKGINIVRMNEISNLIIRE